MLKMVLATARDRARLKEITSVLIRYGLQDILRLLGGGLATRRPRRSRPQDAQTLPERLRARGVGPHLRQIRSDHGHAL